MLKILSLLKQNLINIIIHTSVFLFTGLVLTLINNAKVSAVQINNTSIKIDITENLQTFVNVNINFFNNTSELVAEYNYISPFRRSNNITARVNSSPFPTLTESAKDPRYESLKVNFNSNPVRVNEAGNISINYQAQSAISQRNSLKFLFIPGSNDIYNDYILSYPKSFGSPSFILPASFELIELSNQYELRFKNNKAALIAWGNQYFVSAKFNIDSINNTNTLNGANNNTVQNLLQVPIEDDSQKVYVKDNFSESAWIDSSGNTFLASDNKVENIDLKFRVNKKLSNEDRISDSISIKNSKNVVQLFNFSSSQDNNFLYLQDLNDFLISNFPVSDIKSGVFASSDEYLGVLKRKSEFNSFDFCYVMSSFAQEKNIKTRIDYGYVITPDNFGSQIEPHFWCRAEIDSKVILIDPYFESLVGIKYFGSESDFDRIRVGSWNGDSFNNALGLLQEDGNSIKTISLVDEVFNTNGSVVQVSQKFYVDSGVYSSINVNLQNSSDRIIPIVSSGTFSIDSRNDGLLKQAIKPGENSIKLNGIFESNFFTNTTKTIQVKFNETLKNEVVLNLDVTIRANSFILLSILFVVIILIFIISFFVWKLRSSSQK